MLAIIVIMSLTTGEDTSANVPSEVSKVNLESEQVLSCYQQEGVKITPVTAPRLQDRICAPGAESLLWFLYAQFLRLHKCQRRVSFRCQPQ